VTDTSFGPDAPKGTDTPKGNVPNGKRR